MRRHWRLWKMALRAVLWRATAEPPAIGLRGPCGVDLSRPFCCCSPCRSRRRMRFSANTASALLVGAVVVSLACSRAAAAGRASRQRARRDAADRRRRCCWSRSRASRSSNPREASASSGLWTRADTGIALLLLQSVWLIGAYAAIIRSVDPERRYAAVAPRRGRLRAAGRGAAGLPALSGLRLAGRARQSAQQLDLCARPDRLRSKDDAETRRVDGARVELAQPALMDEAIARLAPQVPGETDVYAIGIAGWAEQDVFIKELEGALAAFGKMLAAAATACCAWSITPTRSNGYRPRCA